MQILFGIALAMLLASSIFIGNAMSSGYEPYGSFFGVLFYFVAMFIPFLGEYNIIHRSFSSMGDNFKKIIGTSRENERKGEAEIILPSSSKVRSKPQGYSLERQTRPHIPCIFFIVVASIFFGFDLTQFFILGEGFPVKDAPISNF